MSVKLDGVDLNSVGDSIEAKNEAGMDDRTVGGFFNDVDRVFGEGNGTLNICGSVKVALNGDMGEVDREKSLKEELLSVNRESDQVKTKKIENEEDVVNGDETERFNGNLGLELKRGGIGEVEATVDRDQNQGMGDDLLPQLVQAGENVTIVEGLNASDRSHGSIVFNDMSNGTGGNEYLIGLNLPVSDGVVESWAPIKEANQNGNPSLKVKDGIIINGQHEDLDGKDVKYGALMPKVRAKENPTEKEGEYYASDIVWSKVRSHPWWPGLIIQPSAASEKAMKHIKKDSYLIAFFGDQTFVWNEASKIKPFRMYFSQMEKQSYSETFSRAVDDALDEVSRQVESGLACRCLHEEVLATVDSLVVISPGIQEQSSRMSSEEVFSKSGYFPPKTLVTYLESLAITPNTAIDRLEFVTLRSQLLAFKRWQGYLQLPVFEDFDGISENEADLSGLQASGILQDGSRKRKHMKTDDQHKKQKKHIMELVRGSSSSLPDGENNHEREASRKLPSGSTGQKRKAVDVISNESGLKRRKEDSLRKTKNASSFTQVGEIICRVTGTSGESTPPEASLLERAEVEHAGKSVNVCASGVSTISNGNSLSRGLSFQEYPPIDEMLSTLAIAAKNLVEGYSSLVSVAGFFSDFRNLKCMEYNDLQKDKKSSGKQKADMPSALESTGALKFEGMEDSYSTDRIVENTLDEPVIVENTMDEPVIVEITLDETNAQKGSLVAEPESVNRLNPNMVNDHETNAIAAGLDMENPSNIMDAPVIVENTLDEPVIVENTMDEPVIVENTLDEANAQKDSLVAEPESVNRLNPNMVNDHETNAIAAGLDMENPSDIVDEKSIEYTPTALILNFNDLASVPDIPNLNEIFTRYGPLDESETQILSKSKRAKVVFKRRSDAETAFSSTGKFSIFGPSLISYRLKYSPTLRKASTASKTKGRRTKSTSAEEGCSMKVGNGIQ